MSDKIKSEEKSENKQPKYSRGKTIVKPQINVTSDENNGIFGLQQTAGNLAVQHLFRTGAIQAKLTINQPGDIYEQEADRVADQVMRMPEPRFQVSGQVPDKAQSTQFQRKCAKCEEEEEEIMSKPLDGVIQRQPVEEEEEMLQSKERPGWTPEVTPGVVSRIESLRGGGQPLPNSVRTFFEPRFGYNFSRVRVHNDTHGADSAQSVNSRAFTVGRNIVFRTGEYAPGKTEGKRLLAHELTHVIQQNGNQAPTTTNGSTFRQAGTAIQRQPDSTGVNPLADKDWFMLKPPPVYTQESYTCWAASLASWLNVRNMSTISDEGLLNIYESPPSTCLDPRGVLLYAHDDAVFGEWWMELKKVEREEWEDVKSMLRTYGHLLVATGTDSSIAHDMVIYGYGFDENGEPCSGCVSLMDPAEGKYRNDTLYNLGFPLYLGVPKSERGNVAGCRRRPLP